VYSTRKFQASRQLIVQTPTPLTGGAELIVKELLQPGEIQSLSKRNLMIAQEQ
jgi:hypothetical protein